MIYLIGAGVSLNNHLTLQSLSTLRKVDKVCFFPTVRGETEELLEALGQTSHEDISRLYVNGGRDYDNYNRIADYMTSCAKKGSVALLLPGHPRVGVSTAAIIEQRAKEAGIAVRVYAGISSFDTMINDLKMDPLEKGSTMLDANRILAYGFALETRVNLFIYHICSVGTSKTFYEQPSAANRLDMLKQYLLKFYAADHKIIILESPVHPDSPGTRHELTLDELDQAGETVHFGTTLFIPALTRQEAKLETAIYAKKCR